MVAQTEQDILVKFLDLKRSDKMCVNDCHYMASKKVIINGIEPNHFICELCFQGIKNNLEGV